jgi:hypothetical protein
MAADADAYAVLGLAPGADAAAVEQAYKKLIKLHHPDRAGGDARRAAEINRAYRELRRSVGNKDPLLLNEELEPSRRRGNAWARAAVVIAIALITLVVAMGPVDSLVQSLTGSGAHPLQLGHVAARASASDPMDQPLALAAIDDAVSDAVRTSRDSDEMALAATSRDCHQRLDDKPSLAGFDRCAAFDDAVVMLEDRDPLRDRGPFAELTVTGRQMSAGKALSDDYLAIDSRLERIRLRVELALAPAPALPAAVNRAEAN